MNEPTLLDRVLAPGGLNVAFQPIVLEDDVNLEVFAFECLTRGPIGTNLEPADVLFEYARRKGAETLLDRACSTNALANAAAALRDVRISLNLHASTLSNDASVPRHLELLADSFGVKPSNVILEIIEHTPVLDERSFLRGLEHLRNAGFPIALDDVGLAHSNYKMMIDCDPEYLKIDRYFVDGAHKDRRRAAVVESVIAFADRIGARVIAEGVETREVHDYLRTVGIDLMQGYYYARPMAGVTAAEWEPAHLERGAAR